MGSSIRKVTPSSPLKAAETGVPALVDTQPVSDPGYCGMNTSAVIAADRSCSGAHDSMSSPGGLNDRRADTKERTVPARRCSAPRCRLAKIATQ